MRGSPSWRVVCRNSGPLCLALVVLAGGCASSGPPPPAPVPSGLFLEGAAIREGTYTPDEAAAAAELILEAERLLEAGALREALDRAERVESGYSTSPGSSRALWVRARVLRDLRDWAAAEAAADSYADLVPEDPAASGRAHLLLAEVRREGGLPGGLESLFEIPPDAAEAELLGAEALASLWASGLATPELRDLTVEAPRHARLLPVFLAELAVRRYLTGDAEEARAIAADALAFSPGASVAQRATGVIDGTISEALEVAASIGGILPIFGSPGVSRLAREIAEGVEVALAVEEGAFSRPIRFVSVEDATDAGDVAAAVIELESQGVAGLIGPLQEGQVATAARSRTTAVPVITPTARLIPDGASGVYSLNGVDPNAAAALAALVLGRGIREVVALHTDSPEMEEEFAWFRQAFTAGGGLVTRVLAYPPGATGFRDQMLEILEIRPQGLVFLLPPQDVELLAPQVAFYGVDELPGLSVFGNQSWTSEGVLQNVQARSTEGVFAVTSWVGEGAFGPGWETFVEAYEEHFQRSLRSPAAGLGYDAARLLLRAARVAGGDPRRTIEAFEGIEGYPGATGFISVTDGRIRRSFVPVRIENRALVLLNP